MWRRADRCGLDLAAQVADVRAQRGDVVGVRRPPDLGQQHRVRQQPPRPRHQRRQQAVLDRREMDLHARPPDGVGGEVELDLAGAQDRLVAVGPRAAQHRMQARDELARAERLRHVVVRAGLERAHLLLLLADRREHDDRHGAPLAQAARDLDAVAVGQHEVEDRRVRRAQRRRVQRLGRRRGGDHVEAVVAQGDPQRAQDLRLVVADEDARTLAHRARHATPAPADAVAGAGSSGSSTTNDVPWLGSDSAHTFAPLTSRKPRAIASPRPEPRWPLRSLPER